VPTIYLVTFGGGEEAGGSGVVEKPEVGTAYNRPGRVAVVKELGTRGWRRR
jgi:hypothetical protein